ncbi:ThuA domain-containing protein [Cyclobacterium plantarum]|uniref:ThuA domain-containing protein n=1 Tax=Cyclobacterium plantarum TaxID=2716263 RepID=A0ABX0HCR0_9BACT|nr:ThuA domain-containing protein [Cyclobacterium plantarum]NHE57755.1 ThuA domain-containing protein [Cyclobacterium plantarum]
MKVLCVYLLILLCMAKVTFAQDEKTSLLVITGGHGFDRLAFFEMMDALGNIEYKELAQPDANAYFLNPEGFDVILFYDMVQEISEAEKAGFEQMVKEGVGLVFLHHAIVSYQDWDFYRDVLGGRYIENGDDTQTQSTYQHDVHFDVKIADKDHPIVWGMEDFEIFDEIYGQVFISPQVNVLISSSHSESMEHLMWTREINSKTRSVYLQPGHGPGIFADPRYRKLLKNSIEWAAFRR